ncbi:ATP-binding cassette domain-containing protein [Sphingomonas sp. BIUV-7]|uniref:ATP-binding cassette domain-containing protein n=1 Tax=Sphingomonas natans TaxID=3063330 RepID=A0ABT8Y9K2_9SPHN|nr:ATP-binding cassette domain-containing protein [Sphingomonas sp. BIUV-7]MDO6415026.1 ATP-binding cassette domain-containing protein [Sphingomonas sp. BIUV-7]
MITLDHVNKRFADGTRALDDVSLDVPQGSVFGVIGRSGAGKSTLLRLINGLEKPSEGEVRVLGAALSGLSPAALRDLRRGIGMIFQSFGLLASRTVAGNVALPLELSKVPRAERNIRVAELLARVGLSDKADVHPARLSGGQRQRVGIARALATRPGILLCDEATSALDPETTRSVLALLGELNRELGLTIVLITHEMSVVRAICDHVAVLDSGRLVEAGPVASVFADARHEATLQLLGEGAG